MCAIGEPSGPIENGTTYIVRPCIEPRNRSVSVSRISCGSRQLLVGPGVGLALGADEGAVLDARDVARVRAREVGVRAASPRRASRTCPRSTSSRQSASYSSAEPSHQWIALGWVRAATSSTHAFRRALFVGASWLRCCGALTQDDQSSFLPRDAAILPHRHRVQRSGRPVARGAARHQHGAPEGRDELVALVVDVGSHLHHAAVRLRLRGPHLEHLGLGVQRVAVEDRRRVGQLLGGEVGDRLARDVAHGHAERERVDQRARPPRSAPAGTARRTRR